MSVVELNDSSFDSEVLGTSQPVLVDFFAVWCGPCKKQVPVMDEVAADYDGRAKICKINVDENSSKTSAYGISSIPALLVFKDGKVVENLVGLHSKSQLSEILDKYL